MALTKKKKEESAEDFFADTRKKKQDYERESVSIDDLDDDDVEEEPGRFDDIDIKSLLLKSVAPAAGALVIGLIIGSVTAPKEVAPQGETIMGVDSIQGTFSILDRVDSVKDSQLKAIQSQIAAWDKDGNDGNKKVAEPLMAVSHMNQASIESFDAFFSILMGVSPYAKNDELNRAQSQLTEYMTPRASTSVLYNLLAGPSAAKELKDITKKSAAVIPLYAGTDGGTYITFVVLVPFATEKSVETAVYTVTSDISERLIDSITYNGVLGDENSTVSKALGEQLSETRSKPHDQQRTIDTHKDSAARQGESLEDIISGVGSVPPEFQKKNEDKPAEPPHEGAE